MTDFFDEALDQAASVIKASKNLIAFTGAGVSAESGIPTFRGQNGLWGKYDERHLELNYFYSHLEESWKTIREVFLNFTTVVEPNDAHKVLAKWQSLGKLGLIVTQNIDGLHTRAGSTNVAEFHGSCDNLVCLQCGKRVPTKSVSLEKLPPLCPCGGAYKPDFVFFGESIPQKAYADSFNAASQADCCIVIGSTGAVYPAAGIPGIVKRNGGAIVEINPEPSGFTDTICDVFVRMKAGDAMTKLDSMIW